MAFPQHNSLKTSQSIKQSINQRIDRSIKQSKNQPMNESVGSLINKSISELFINRIVDQSYLTSSMVTIAYEKNTGLYAMSEPRRLNSPANEEE